ncbi:hypothetical protein DUNSADRAFT_9712 [Dunaliella salina]|uniref:Encoded protein n=1 Tax=Dunaliella salina TaxID=3046 RepID=A0ABQ7GGW0_DUNSA|nr:hypothetical protein DUNSADRAFT_9712 [Dunaliella salina]|eukprot:KAF5833838.1 hypothetical protein DUNSADRAFT_9712 [Dunaliella salina]
MTHLCTAPLLRGAAGVCAHHLALLDLMPKDAKQLRREYAFHDCCSSFTSCLRRRAYSILNLKLSSATPFVHNHTSIYCRLDFTSSHEAPRGRWTSRGGGSVRTTWIRSRGLRGRW